MKNYSFEKLNVWQNSRVLNKEVYILTKSFPKTEIYAITNQIRRASVSVCSNIAEGVSRFSAKDKARFMEISYGSLMELLNQLILACDLEYMNNEKLNNLRLKIDKIGNQINALRKSFLAN